MSALEYYQCPCGFKGYVYEWKWEMVWVGLKCKSIRKCPDCGTELNEKTMLRYAYLRF